MSRTRLPLAFLIVTAWLIAIGNPHAQLPHIRLDRIFPLGGKAGTQVLVEIAGNDLEEANALHFDDPGLKAVLVKPNQFLVPIAPAARRGSPAVRAIGR